jgi:alpha-beta hydrolase superfamily lysophospholipase
MGMHGCHVRSSLIVIESVSILFYILARNRREFKKKFSSGQWPFSRGGKMTAGHIIGILRMLGAFAVLMGSVGNGGLMASESSAITFDADLAVRVRSEIMLLDPRKPPHYAPATEAYFRFYKLSFKDVSHFFGYIPSRGRRIATHYFYPSGADATVFILHGYLDHSGIMRHLIHACIQQRFAVVSFDLPGHGLSTGTPVDIEDFSEYAATLDDVIHYCPAALPAPFFAVGHSTGSAVLLEFFHQRPAVSGVLKRIVFVAPLIRHAYWHMSQFHYHLLKPFVQNFPRPFRTNSSDPRFLQFLRNDPLEGRQIPLSWLNALYAWNRRLERYETPTVKILVLQGTADAVVDWRYNLSHIRENLPMAVIKEIRGGRHHLLNESQELRDEVLAKIMRFFCLGPASNPQ